MIRRLRLSVNDGELQSHDDVVITVIFVGDFNVDGSVNAADLYLFCQYYLQHHPFLDVAPYPEGDGIINFLDYVEFTRHWLDGRD